MHAPKEDNVITFNAYINLNDIDNYFHNEDKLTYMELLARDLKEGIRVSSKEFKILNVPKDTSQDVIEQAIIILIRSKQFYIKKLGIKPSKNNQYTNIIFITIKDLEKCNLLKNTWSIEINHHFYRFAPAHASEQDLMHRK
ncbi:hypothetical protein GLOIN_2v1820860 [Rhizophagus clarus]|uniref:Uncharacterized protein n=1 Tax=Rhizophagus clarus TaxID=94130 RepID=A0A8H3QLF3_9GLOM|nr:hypothetical protein GLOIN_2v1820860 [Rhizophagus clarus]